MHKDKKLGRKGGERGLVNEKKLFFFPFSSVILLLCYP